MASLLAVSEWDWQMAAGGEARLYAILEERRERFTLAAAVADPYKERVMPDAAAFAVLPAAWKRSAVRLATYNIHGCVGVDRRYDPERVAAVLREIGAGIACLQEVAIGGRGERRSDQARFLAEATGSRLIFGSGVRDHRRRFRNAILTRFPVLAESAIDLTIAGCEPRSAIDADLAIGERVLRVIATHFGLSGAERQLQANRVLAALAAPLPANRYPAATVLVMGDLNEWRGRRGGIRALERRLGPSFPLRTFPSFMPILALDRIYVDERAVLDGVEVYATPLARLASDHLPLLATLCWSAPFAVLSAPLRRGRRRKLHLLSTAATFLRSHQQKRRATPTGR
jgi:endonuclease/exonuclease/phosphatase family metal-dependent hydrolase